MWMCCMFGTPWYILNFYQYALFYRLRNQNTLHLSNFGPIFNSSDKFGLLGLIFHPLLHPIHQRYKLHSISCLYSLLCLHARYTLKGLNFGLWNYYLFVLSAIYQFSNCSWKDQFAVWDFSTDIDQRYKNQRHLDPSMGLNLGVSLVYICGFINPWPFSTNRHYSHCDQFVIAVRIEWLDTDTARFRLRE